MQPIIEQIQAIREQLDAAECTWAIGHILVTLSRLTDLIERLAADAIEQERDELARRAMDELADNA